MSLINCTSTYEPQTDTSTKTACYRREASFGLVKAPRFSARVLGSAMLHDRYGVRQNVTLAACSQASAMPGYRMCQRLVHSLSQLTASAAVATARGRALEQQRDASFGVPATGREFQTSEVTVNAAADARNSGAFPAAKEFVASFQTVRDNKQRDGLTRRYWSCVCTTAPSVKSPHYKHGPLQS